MLVSGSTAEIRREVAAARKRGARWGLVPTMGALHRGHLSLIEAARHECEVVAVSIFVNPAQFGPQEDFTRYPRPLEQDLAHCRSLGVDLVYQPDVSTVYPSGFCTFVEVAGLSDVLEGKFRPGHFRGVTTVVLKLLNVVQPDIAFFGQKDFQQQLILRRMARELDLPCEIRTCPTVRDPDGLALSSRNVYLSAEERESALSLHRSLLTAQESLRQGETRLDVVRRRMLDILTAAPAVRPDYATIVDSETLVEPDLAASPLTAVVAARVGSTRLIDNLPLLF